MAPNVGSPVALLANRRELSDLRPLLLNCGGELGRRAGGNDGSSGDKPRTDFGISTHSADVGRDALFQLGWNISPAEHADDGVERQFRMAGIQALRERLDD